LAALVLFVAAIAAALLAPAQPRAAESAYIACIGIGDPADVGVCMPSPYPDRLPLP
jgi:hypothetical protein